MNGRFDPAVADRYWQERWDEEDCFRAESGSDKPFEYDLAKLRAKAETVA